MLTLLFAAFVLATLGWMIQHRAAAAIAAVFLLFTLVTRTLSLIYVDLAGPAYAEQLDDLIGGGASMPLFACSVLVLMATLSVVFRPSRLARTAAPTPQRSGTRDGTGGTVLILAGLFVLALYADMLVRGRIPLLTGTDRLEYNAEVAGPLHALLFDFGFMLAAVLGTMFVRPRLAGRDFDFAFFVLYIAVLAYFTLTGNRFSSFYSFTSFFVLPLAALPTLAVAGRLPRAPARSPLKRLLCSRSAVWLALGLGAIGVATLLLNSVINVRGYDNPFEQLTQRVLIQPVELWWTTWRDLDTRLPASFAEAWNALFVNPIDPTRNTSIQMLMLKNLGDERTTELLDLGQQYTGGYPEVLFELLGPWLALPAALLFSVPTALLLRLVVVGICEGRLLTALMALYVYFGFSLLFIGGMLNFLVAWTFWVKIALLIVVYVVERSARRATPPPAAPRPTLGGAQ